MPEHIKKKLEQEIQVLEHELNHELPKELKKAVAMGDLSENAEYHMAKQRQEFVRARLGQLKSRMADLSLVNMANIPERQGCDRLNHRGLRLHQRRGDRVQAGDQRRIRRDQGTYLHHVTDRPRPARKKVGDISEVVTPNGKRELEVLKLITIHDEA